MTWNQARLRMTTNQPSNPNSRIYMHILFTYLVLAFTTGLYSWYLDLRHERTYINPDITVIEVIVGTFTGRNGTIIY
mgnify:CR=1 FL=1